MIRHPQGRAGPPDNGPADDDVPAGDEDPVTTTKKGLLMMMTTKTILTTMTMTMMTKTTAIPMKTPMTINNVAGCRLVENQRFPRACIAWS